MVLTIGTEILKLLITGILGGIIGGWIGLRTFRSQKKIEIEYQDNIQKREALRDILIFLPLIVDDVIHNKTVSEGSSETREEYLLRLKQNVIRWQTLFLNDKDVYEVLFDLYHLVGSDWETLKDSAESRKDSPSSVVHKIRDTVEKKLKVVERLLY